MSAAVAGGVISFIMVNLEMEQKAYANPCFVCHLLQVVYREPKQRSNFGIGIAGPFFV